MALSFCFACAGHDRPDAHSNIPGLCDECCEGPWSTYSRLEATEGLVKSLKGCRRLLGRIATSKDKAPTIDSITEAATFLDAAIERAEQAARIYLTVYQSEPAPWDKERRK